MITPAKTPQGRFFRPKVPNAEVRWSDRSWRPVLVVAWARLIEPRRQQSGHTVTWAVRLRFADDSEGWYFYAPGDLRPVRMGQTRS